MDPHSKKPKLIGSTPNAEAAAGNADAADPNSILAQLIVNADNNNNIDDTPDLVIDESNENDPTINGMSTKLMANILGCLSYRDIMRSRICCKKFRDAAKTTLVPWSECTYEQRRDTKFRMNSVQTYKAMVAMTQALPKLQQLEICDVGSKNKFCDGLDPNEEKVTNTASWTVYDIQMISSFRQLRYLRISYSDLNGRYPFLFDFPLLEELEISYSADLKWDLAMLAGFPILKILRMYGFTTEYPTGNIKSLRVLKDTLEKVDIRSRKIEGDLMDLADFPHLKLLDLHCPKVTGDLRLVKVDDFPKLSNLILDLGVIGASDSQFQHISDAPSIMEAIYRLSQRETTFISNIKFHSLSLSKDSPEWYDKNGKQGHPDPPFSVQFVRVGPRVGWRWMTKHRYRNATNACEVNWLDPEPDRESNEYADYIRELESIQEEIFCFEGYHEPPSEEEYKRLCDEYYDI